MKTDNFEKMKHLNWRLGAWLKTEEKFKWLLEEFPDSATFAITTMKELLDHYDEHYRANPNSPGHKRDLVRYKGRICEVVKTMYIGDGQGRSLTLEDGDGFRRVVDVRANQCLEGFEWLSPVA